MTDKLLGSLFLLAGLAALVYEPRLALLLYPLLWLAAGLKLWGVKL